MKVAGYIRVSTEEQSKEGYSLDAQREKLINYCKSQEGWELVEIYPEEGRSAKDLNRPELQRMLEDAINRKYDVILVYRLDRLTRSVIDLYDLLQQFEQHSIKFKSATEVYDTTTAMGKLFITIVAALAQWERENLSERVRFGMEELVRKGNWHGGPVPFGYKWEDKQMTIVPEESKILRKMRDTYMSGEGLGSTSKALNALGLLRRGKKWSAQSVWYTLDNPFYAGRIRYGEKKKNGKYASRKKEERVNVIWSDTGFPTIFTWEEYQEHKDRMQRKEFYGHSKKREYRFSGVMHCARCGGRLIGRPYRNKKINGEWSIPYYNYICSGRSMSMGCDLPLLKQELAEKLIMEHIEKISLEVTRIPQQSEETTDGADEVKLLQKELKVIADRRKKWQYMFTEDLISADDLRERKKEDDEKESFIKEQIEKIQFADSKVQKLTIDKMLKIRDIWELIDDGEKKEMMQTLFKRIVVDCEVKNGKKAAAKGKFLPFHITEIEYN